MKIKFVQALKYCVPTQSDGTTPQKLQQSIKDQEKGTDDLKSVEESLLSLQMTPIQKPQELLTSGPSQSQQLIFSDAASKSLQLNSIGEESDKESTRATLVSQMKKLWKSTHISSTLTKEFLQLLSEVKESDKLYKSHWMYGLDSGGQAAFLDIAPALLRYHSLNIVFFRLDEKLNDAANLFYSVDERNVGEGEKRQVSTMQLTKAFFDTNLSFILLI